MADDGWIEWHGGECPVPAGALVYVRFRNGVVGGLSGERVREYGWDHEGAVYDIVAYRISKPAEPTKPNTSAETALWQAWAGFALGALVQRGVRGDTPEKLAEAAGVVADAMLTEAKKRGRV